MKRTRRPAHGSRAAREPQPDTFWKKVRWVLKKYSWALIVVTIHQRPAVAGYQVAAVGFLTLIDNLVTLLEYELKYYEVLLIIKRR
ncbi:MAG: hypothetical protein HY314_07900 [Acidobacteria bacterium]|nr:hypothetical protein [Acidobacteriota bacterium]